MANPEIKNDENLESKKTNPELNPENPEPPLSAVHKAIKSLEKSPSNSLINNTIRDWIESVTDPTEDAGVRDLLKEKPNLTTGALFETMADVYLRKNPEQAKEFSKNPDISKLALQLIPIIRTNVEDYGVLVEDLDRETKKIQDEVNQKEQPEKSIPQKIDKEKPLLEFLLRQKKYQVQKAKEYHELKLQESITALKSTEDAWKDVQSAQGILSRLIEKKYYDTFYFTSEGSLMTEGEPKDYHLNEEGHAQLEQQIDQAEKSYYQILDIWHQKSAESDKLLKEEQEAEAEISKITSSFDKRIKILEEEAK